MKQTIPLVFLVIALSLSSCQISNENDYNRDRRVSDLFQTDVASGVTRQLTDDSLTYNWAMITHSGGMVSVWMDEVENQTLSYTPTASMERRRLQAVEIFPDVPYEHCGIHQKILLTNDQQKIIYCNHVSSGSFSLYGMYSQEICTINIDGSGFEQLATYPYGTAVGGISLAPDGKHILYDEANFKADATVNSTNIILLDLQTKEKMLVRHFDSSLVVAPQYVPNTSDIVFYEEGTQGDDALKLLLAENPSSVKTIASARLISATNFPVIAQNDLMPNFNRDGEYELIDLKTFRKTPLHMYASKDGTFICLTQNGLYGVVAGNIGTPSKLLAFNTTTLATTTIPYDGPIQRIKPLAVSEDGNTVLLLGEHTITE